MAGEGTLAAGEDPEHEVRHPEGEGDDGVTEDQSQQENHHGTSWKDQHYIGRGLVSDFVITILIVDDIPPTTHQYLLQNL